MSIEMQPGDTLYIPRGVLHDAIATEQTSLHVTLGVYAITLRDVLLEMTQQLAAENPLYRRSLPRDLLLNDEFPDVNKEIKDLFSLAFTPENINKAFTAIQDSHAIDSSPNCEGMLSMSTAINEYSAGKNVYFNQSTSDNANLKVVRFKSGNLLGVERSGDTLRLRTHGQVLNFSPTYHAAIDLLLSQNAQTISDLPSLDDAEKSILIEKLVSANLLTFAPS